MSIIISKTWRLRAGRMWKHGKGDDTLVLWVGPIVMFFGNGLNA